MKAGLALVAAGAGIADVTQADRTARIAGHGCALAVVRALRKPARRVERGLDDGRVTRWIVAACASQKQRACDEQARAPRVRAGYRARSGHHGHSAACAPPMTQSRTSSTSSL